VLNYAGLFTFAGSPIDIDAFILMNKAAKSRAFRSNIVAEAAAPRGLSQQGTYPLGAYPGPVEMRLLPRATVNKVYHHPLGMSEHADCRRLLPRINEAIDVAVGRIALDEAEDERDVPRSDKVRRQSAHWADMQNAVSDAMAHKTKVAQRSGEPAGLAMAQSALLVPSSRPSARSIPIARADGGEASAPPSIVPELMELLRTHAKPGVQAERFHTRHQRRIMSSPDLGDRSR